MSVLAAPEPDPIDAGAWQKQNIELLAHLFQQALRGGAEVGFDQRFTGPLEGLRKLIPATSASVAVIDLRARRPELDKDHVLGLAIDPGDLREYLRRHITRDPCYASILRGEGHPGRLSDALVSSGSSGASQFLRFLGSIGVEHVLGWSFRLVDGTTLVAALHRERGEEDFSRAELALARCAAPVLSWLGIRGAVVRRIGADARRGLRTASSLVLGHDGSILHMDASAAGLLAAYPGASEQLRSSILAGDGARGRRAVELSVGSLGSLNATAEPIRSGSDGPLLVVLELRSRDADGGLASRGLSPRERQVAHRVALGWTDQQIAQALGCSEHYVRRCLEGITRKTGARGRARITALVYEALADHGLMPRPAGRSS